MLDNDGGFTTSVPTVPSREAVEAYFKRGPKDGMFTAWVAEGHAMLRALYAEVERLNEDKESYRRTANELAERVAKAEIDRDDLRATVAEQGALIKQWEARCQAAWDQSDKDGDKMRGMAIKLAEQGAALAAVRYLSASWHLHGNPAKWDYANELDAAVASAQSGLSQVP